MTRITSPTRWFRKQVAFVLVCVALCLVGFGFLWVRAGGPVPGPNGYEVSFLAPDLKNLQPVGDVRAAGVLIGTVKSLQATDQGARVTVRIDSDAAPLHTGATVRVGVKSMVGQSYLEVVDGNGAAIRGGSVLPPSSVLEATDIDELISTFDAPTRRSLSRLLVSAGSSTEGTADSVSQVFTGLGDTGDEGAVALRALADQSADLRTVMARTTLILQALDTGRGQIADLVRTAGQLTAVTAAQRRDLEATVRRLPALLDSASNATSSLGDLSGDLAPVAASLRQASVPLNHALRQLPATSADLRALTPNLNTVLDRLPATLDRTPQFGDDTVALAAPTYSVLSDVNPMLQYMRPYWLDIGSFFGNFGSSFNTPVENGIKPVHLAGIFNMFSVRGNPLKVPQMQPLLFNSPYPAPGAAADASPSGTYPRVERESH